MQQPQQQQPQQLQQQHVGGGYRPSPALQERRGVVVPPPYRAPPPRPQGVPGGPQIPPHPLPKGANIPYSRFNLSEPNMAQYTGSPVGYRHTINHENSSQVQNNLKQILNFNKHQTLDNSAQNQALHHLKMQGLHQNGNYTNQGPDNIRNTASRMFNRTDKNMSPGYVGNNQPPQFSQHYPQNLNQSAVQSANHSLNQSMEMVDQVHNTSRTNLSEEAAKRNSYGNQSFRAALQSPGHQQQQQQQQQQHNQNQQQLHNHQKQMKQPPQVPPKPASRSASRERQKEQQNEENEKIDTELKNILRGGVGGGNTNLAYEKEKNNGTGTPILPPLSPSHSASHTPQSSPDFRVKYKMNKSPNYPGPDQQHNDTGKQVNKQDQGFWRASTKEENMPSTRENTGRNVAESTVEVASTTTGLDLESVMALQTDLTSDEELSTTIDLSDAQAIRKQLDGLENMYTEVLKLLGLRKFGRAPVNGADVKTGGPLAARRKMYGSLSSLPSVSSIGSRHIYGKESKRKEERKSRSVGKDKNYNKRFQRLESHVVTLARSVAHLSSEMRTQHAMVQEIEALRNEIQQVKQSRNVGHHTNSLPRGGVLEPAEFFSNHPRVSQQTENRVKKLTKFFGDEPPLLRLYLKNLGYEKYAAIFEEAKIGMLELPYLSEERLEKLGIPLGPRIRILQEAKIPYNVDGQNYNVYIL